MLVKNQPRHSFAAVSFSAVLCTAALGIACNKKQVAAPAPATNAVLLAATNVITITPKVEEEEVEFDIDKSTEHLTEGNALLAAGKVPEAVEQYKLAVKYNPEDEDLFYNLALAQARMGDTAAAKRNYAKSLEIYPDYIEAHNNLGNLLVSEGKYDEAITHFEKAVANGPGNASAHNNLGNAYARQNKIAQSLVHFQTAVELKADYPEAQFNLGNAYLILGRTDEAVKEFTRLLRLHPNFARAQIQLDKALRQKSQEASN